MGLKQFDMSGCSCSSLSNNVANPSQSRAALRLIANIIALCKEYKNI